MSEFLTKLFRNLLVIFAVFFGLNIVIPVAFALTISPPFYEIGAVQGQVLKTGLKVFNETDKAGTFYFDTQNFVAKGEEGEPYFISEEIKEDLASWIETPNSIHLEPGELKQVEFTIRVPENASPGGHYAAIFLSTSPSAIEGGTVGVAARIGTLVLLKIGGEVVEEGKLVNFELINGKSIFEHLPVDFLIRIKNTGTVHIKPSGVIEIRNIFGIKTAEVKVNLVKTPDGKEKPVGNILPQSVRKFEAKWQIKDSVKEPKTFWQKVRFEKENFALGRYQAKLNLSYGTNNEKKITDVVYFWVFPWHLILVSFIALVLVLFLLAFIIRRYNRWIIEKAKIKNQNENEKIN